ncbi:MAG: hypothetical protein ACRC2T_17225 [Thermoguttaceae bacterium]
MNFSVETAKQVTNFLENNFPEVPIERAYNPILELSKIDETKIYVVPRETERKQISRGTNQHTVTINVIILKKLKTAEPEAIDAQMELVEQIAGKCDGVSFDIAAGAKCVSVANSPIYVEKWISTHRQFTSRLVLEFTILERL